MIERRNLGRAAAEILIIVAGVLLALWAESWRQSREERLLGGSYLERLLVDVQADSLRFARIRFFAQEYLRAAEAVQGTLRDGSASFDAVELAFSVARAGAVNPDNTVTSTYDDLVSSGRLVLIEGQELRAQIQRYYTDLGRRVNSLNDAPTAFRDLARRSLPGRFVREAQQCMWVDWDLHAGLTTPAEEECHPEISPAQASAGFAQLQDEAEVVTGLLNEVIWHARDVDFKFRVQELRRTALQERLEGLLGH